MTREQRNIIRAHEKANKVWAALYEALDELTEAYEALDSEESDEAIAQMHNLISNMEELMLPWDGEELQYGMGE